MIFKTTIVVCQIKKLLYSECIFLMFFDAMATTVCVLLCFINSILEIVMVPGFSRVNSPQIIITWGGRILTLHLIYIAGYTGPLLFLFEQTHNYPVDDQGLSPWWLRCLGGSKVRSSSLVRFLSDGKISWVMWSQGLWNLPPPMAKQSNTCLKKKLKEKHPRCSHLRAT